LLDSYEAERIPVAQRLLNTTDRAFMLLVSDGWFARLLRTRILARMAAFAMRFERVQTLAFRTIAQIGIRYRRSALSKNLAKVSDAAPQAGDRFPWLRLALRAGGATKDLYERLDDTRFNLIVVGQPATGDNFGDLVRTLVVPDDPASAQALADVRIHGPAFFLLRPDGHIGLAGTHLDPAAVSRYLAASGFAQAASPHHDL
jgi:hypothetical protein